MGNLPFLGFRLWGEGPLEFLSLDRSVCQRDELEMD